MWFIPLSVILAIILELALKGAGVWWLSPPLVALVIFFWFWRTALGARMMLGFTVGLLLDILGPFPFGTHTAVFLILGVFTEFLQQFFSDVKSPVTQVITVGLLFFLFRLLTPSTGFLLSLVGKI